MVIEYVRDGASFRAIVLSNNTYINLSLAGVQAPRVNTPAKSAAPGGLGYGRGGGPGEEKPGSIAC